MDVILWNKENEHIVLIVRNCLFLLILMPILLLSISISVYLECTVNIFFANLFSITFQLSEYFSVHQKIFH